MCVCVCEDVQHLKILCPSVLLSVSHVCVFKCVCMWVCMCTCVCMCVCIYVCVCAYVCVHQGASEASGYGVRINVLCPGFAQTDILTSLNSKERSGQFSHLRHATETLLQQHGVLE